jgi:catechol-2,3-dioxygenase
MNIQALTLKTRDLCALSGFYTNVLGLPVQLSPPELHVQIGTTRLTFQQDTAFYGFYHLALDIPPHQAKEAEAWLQRRVTLLSDPDGNTRFGPGKDWNTTNLYFEDPKSNILELIARHDTSIATSIAVPIKTSRHFGAGSLQRVSELGVVVPNVPKAVQRLGERFGLSPFNGDDETFTPVGGHDGMLIVVKEGRGWFPIRRPAVAAPFCVEFTADGRQRRITHHDLKVIPVAHLP